MIVHVITNVHNEALMMPYFLRHYESFADRIFVYDAGSDDGTRELVHACPKATLIDWDCPGVNDEIYMALNNSAYIDHSRGVADWVIMADADEFVYHSDILGVLDRYSEQGVNVAVPRGFNMVHPTFPATQGQIYEEVKMGCPGDSESKPCVFDPILTMNFGAGKHHASPQPAGLVTYADDGALLMLHQAFLGLQFRLDRMAARKARMSQTNIERGWGLYNLDSPETIENHYRAVMQLRTKVIEQ